MYKNSQYEVKPVSWPSYLDDINPCASEDGLYIKMGPI